MLARSVVAGLVWRYSVDAPFSCLLAVVLATAFAGFFCMVLIMFLLGPVDMSPFILHISSVRPHNGVARLTGGSASSTFYEVLGVCSSQPTF